MLSNALTEVFETLNTNNIRYIIIRGYFSDEEIENGKDIDIYIHPEDKHKSEELLNRIGWHTAKINTNVYPHKQFYKLEKKCYKLDIQYGLYFANSSLSYVREEDVILTSSSNGTYAIPSNEHAFNLLLCHIVYDKKVLEKHNKERLKALLNQTGYNKKQEVFIERIKSALYNENDSDLLLEMEHYLSKYCLLTERNNLFNLGSLFVKGKLRSICMRLKRKSIAFIGVDGTGKSTLIKSLNKLLADRSTVIYMGDKNYDNPVAIKHAGDGSIKGHLAVYRNMWSRYMRKRYEYSGVILFDRYVDERYINAPGKSKWFYKLIYKFLFPKPKYYIYLYCDAARSMERKNDIINSEQFIMMKNRFDKEFLDRKNILSIDTNKYSIDETTALVENFINKKCLEWIM